MTFFAIIEGMEITRFFPTERDAYDCLCSDILYDWGKESFKSISIGEMQNINRNYDKAVAMLDSSYKDYCDGKRNDFGYAKPGGGLVQVKKCKEIED